MWALIYITDCPPECQHFSIEIANIRMAQNLVTFCYNWWTHNKMRKIMIQRKTFFRIYQENKLDMKTVKKYFYLYVFFIVITLLISLIINADYVKFLQTSMSGRVSNSASEGNIFLYFIYNNALKVPILIFLIALIPIPYTYVTVLLANGVLLGFAFSIPITHPKISFINLLLGIGINSLFEQSAILVIVTCASYINKYVCRKIYFRKKYVKSNDNILIIIKKVIVSYLLYALPLFIIAAIIEAYLVPILPN